MPYNCSPFVNVSPAALSIITTTFPVGAIAMLAAVRIVPESHAEAERRSFDAAGAVTVTGGL